MTSDHAAYRTAALLAAAELAAVRGWNETRLLAAADLHYAWLTRPAPIVGAEIVAGIPVDRTKGTNVSLTMPDNDKVTLSVMAMDALKVPVPGNTFTDPAGPFLAPFTWTVDNTALAQITVSPDTLSVDLESAVGQVGTVTVTATDVNGKAMAPFAVEIDPSAATTAGIVAGTPVLRTDIPA